MIWTLWLLNISKISVLHRSPAQAGEMEMQEQTESVELDGEIHIDIETFTVWAAYAEKCLCAKILLLYARDALLYLNLSLNVNSAYS